jgi:muramoyltetrapeptide carboxypeptidase LdcA involved in peptidoglycan recycling
MRYPEFLKDGGSIGFPAPSFGPTIEPYKSAFHKAMEYFREQGYLPYPGNNSEESCGIGISNLPVHCGGELTAMYADEDIDTLISCGGGELMCEILDYVDFGRIRKIPPKWFMGYSDNTNFTYLLATMCDTASIYGPCADKFGAEELHASVTDALALLKGEKLTMSSYDAYETEPLKSPENPLAPINATEARIHRIFDGKDFLDDARQWTGQLECSGRLIGGCMDCLVNLLGTVYDNTHSFLRTYASDGFIWFLEACDLNVFDMRRAMWQMDHAGWFQNVRGFLIGRPENGEPILNLDAWEAFLPIARKYRVPMILEMDLGHVAPMMPLIVGSYATVTAQGNDCRIAMELK